MDLQHHTKMFQSATKYQDNQVQTEEKDRERHSKDGTHLKETNSISSEQTRTAFEHGLVHLIECRLNQGYTVAIWSCTCRYGLVWKLKGTLS